MPRKRKVAHEGYPGKDVGEPNLAEREFEIGKDEAWFAKIDRDFEGFSDLLFERKHNREAVAEQDRQTSSYAYKKMVENGDLAAKQYLERLNMHNTSTLENINQQNDAMFLLLAKGLDEDGEVELVIRRPRKIKGK